MTSGCGWRFAPVQISLVETHGPMDRWTKNMVLDRIFTTTDIRTWSEQQPIQSLEASHLCKTQTTPIFCNNVVITALMITTTSLTPCQTYIANVDRVCWFSSSGSLQSKAIQKYNYDLAESTKSAGFQHPTRLKRVSWFTSCHAKIRSKADLPLPAVPASKTGALMASKRRKRSWKATWNQKHER